MLGNVQKQHHKKLGIRSVKVIQKEKEPNGGAFRPWVEKR